MSAIVRNDPNPRLARSVVHGNTIYLTGVSTTVGNDIVAQTQEVLRRIDGYLTAAGSDKTRVLQATIWLKNIQRDFPGLNEVWVPWIGENVPARSTCQAELAEDAELVEITIIAAI
ncbi:RidA family protein [Pollutimonas bauzanensis]|uniref:Enamine deaminase RidA, house cleaning of reactive enamine intermediates, YjgF/YER057c/UK114 family n=1 Tax=Pollutimonas bauzanensis TaxID=658167 RepID=A0A1M5LVV6_9BURK|nr:RidA family protein [Pollutimonas bauzanensis]SHG69151.1 Enamine deaminase RidA, house cleaning of reactive enamine intermediates, YjgF/YER057c/UK114 family [Pollutimonas bauzanensis]